MMKSFLKEAFLRILIGSAIIFIFLCIVAAIIGWITCLFSTPSDIPIPVIMVIRTTTLWLLTYGIGSAVRKCYEQ